MSFVQNNPKKKLQMQNINYLTHQEIVELHREGKISIRANMSAAMHICDADPRISRSSKAAHQFWKWIGILMFLGGPISLIFLSWYWSLLIFLLSFPVMSATRQTAGQFVSEACLENESLYYECLQAGLLLIQFREK